MFENREPNYRRTVKEGVSNKKWAGCKDLIAETGVVNCLGFIQGTNSWGVFTALVCDNGTNYYIPKWLNDRFRAENFTDEELEYLMSGKPVTVTKREYINAKTKEKQFTYDIKIGEYKM